MIGRVKSELHFQLPLIVLSFAYALAAVLVAQSMQQDVNEGVFTMVESIKAHAKFGAVIIFLFALFRPSFSPQGGQRGLRAIARSFLDILSPINLLTRLLPIVVCIIAMNVAFGFFKKNITAFVPFSWDHAFADLDELLFLGNVPWELSHALFPGSLAAMIIGIIYAIWFFMMFGVWVVEAFRPGNDPVRLKFFISFLLVLLVAGNVVATIFSSAGPCFYDALYGGERFVPLMDMLKAYDFDHPLAFLKLQERLWATYIGAPGPKLYAISAFPSLHVAVAVLLCFLAAERGRLLLILMIPYTIAIQIGSVHLGWHYAVDGVGGGLIAWGCWWFAGVIVNYWVAWISQKEPQPQFA